MVDAEVMRLRKLRDLALRARALAKALDFDSSNESSVFARSALICWSIARVASGRLRAHPYLSYQGGPSRLRELADSLRAALVAANARRQNRCLSVYAQQLQSVAREIDDVRSLTWSADLSDALGRMQNQMRGLAVEFDLGARSEGGAAKLRAPLMTRVEAGDTLRRQMIADGSWPYLAIR